MKKTTEKDETTPRGVRMGAISFTKVVIAGLGLLLSGAAWLFRRTWTRYREERKMLLELYAFNFGSDQIDMSLEDDSVEERLERGNERFERLVKGQRRIYENQEKIVDRLDHDVELRELPSKHDQDRYRDERRNDD